MYFLLQLNMFSKCPPPQKKEEKEEEERNKEKRKRKPNVDFVQYHKHSITLTRLCVSTLQRSCYIMGWRDQDC